MGILRWAQRHLFAFHKTCRVILPLLGASRSIWHDRPEPLRAHLTHSHINWTGSSRNLRNSPTRYKTCRELQIWNCKAKYAGVEIWCGSNLMRRRTVMRVLHIIKLNQLRFGWKMLVYRAIHTASWLRPIYCFTGHSFSLAGCDEKWDLVPEISRNNQADLWALCTLLVWELRWEITWTDIQKQERTHSPTRILCKRISSTHLNITSCVYSQEQHFFFCVFLCVRINSLDRGW